MFPYKFSRSLSNFRVLKSFAIIKKERNVINLEWNAYEQANLGTS